MKSNGVEVDDSGTRRPLSVVGPARGGEASDLEANDQTQALQREAARTFGRKLGDRIGRESLWQVKKGIEVD